MSFALLLVTAAPGLNVPQHVPLRHGRPVAVRLAIGEVPEGFLGEEQAATAARHRRRRPACPAMLS